MRTAVRSDLARPLFCVKNLRLVSGLMAYGHEHKCTWVETEKINSTLDEWVGDGWELITAYCGPSGTVTHYLYFRREVGGPLR
jgi:hypothetical protein